MKGLEPSQSVDLTTRKLLLQQRSTVLRHLLAVQANQVGQAVAPWVQAADQVRSGGRWARRHPVWVVAAVAALLIWRPQAMAGVTSKAWSLWQLWRRWRPLLREIWGEKPTQ